MKILWIGDGGSYTGFAKVTHSIGDRLVTDYGHEVWCLATNFNGDHWDSPMKMFVPTTVVPNDVYGQARFLELAAKLGPDAIVMLQDPQVVLSWLLNNKYDPEHLLLKHWFGKVVAYLPLDGSNTPPMYSAIGPVATRVAMSKHGQAQMPGSRLIYHGVDVDRFWPVSPQRPIKTEDGVLRSKRDCKQALGFARDAFVIGRIDSNSGRKDYGALWRALIPVMRRHSNVFAYWLCQVSGADGGVNLKALWSREPDLANRFQVPESYSRKRGPANGWSESEINVVYNAFDLFVSTSRGEGFGLTIAEALACGVPVIAQNVSAIPEVVGPGGTLLEPQRPLIVPFGQDQWLADVDAFSEAIERAYLSSAWRRGAGSAGREHVSNSFRWDEATAAFHALLTEVATHDSPAPDPSPELATAAVGG